MSRTKYEPPIRFVGQIVDATLEGAAELDRQHYDACHIPPRRTAPVQAVPFPDQRVPDVEAARMIELMETEGISPQEAAYRFHRPASLLLRCMADYEPQFRRFIQQRRAG